MTVYPTAMTHCAACGTRVKTTRNLCFYMVRPTTALTYLLCKSCGAQVSEAGLPPELLAKVDENMEAEARAYGFTQTH